MADEMTVCIDLDGDEFEVPTDSLKMRLAVYGVIVKDGKLLLLPHEQGGYDLPGGGVELGETTREALGREVREETGLNVEMQDVLRVKTSFYAGNYISEGYLHSTLIYYRCKIIDGDITTDNFDTFAKENLKKAEWVDINKLSDIEVASTIDWREYLDIK